MKYLTTHLTWDRSESIAAKRDVLTIAESAGLASIFEAIEQRKLDLVTQLLTRTPSDSGAEYERIIGQIRGLEEVPMIVEGVIEHGRRNERAVENESEPVH